MTQTNAMKMNIKIYISLAAITVFMMLGASAQAMIQERGTFVPYVCGSAGSEIAFEVTVRTACFGKIAGFENLADEGAASLSTSDGQNHVFKVARTVNRLVSFENGLSEMIFFLESADGETAQIKTTRAKNGNLLSAIGRYGTSTFVIPEFTDSLVIQ